MIKNNKFSKALALVLVLVTLSLCVLVMNGCMREISGVTEDGFEYEIKYSGQDFRSVTITGYNSDEKDVIIPKEINDEELGEVVSVGHIGAHVFDGCETVESVYIHENIFDIDSQAFSGAPNLEEIEVDKENETYDSRNGCNAVIKSDEDTLVAGCLGSTIPKGVVAIGPDAFKGCKKLKNISIPEDVKWIDSGAFDGCTSLRSVNIPEGNWVINENTFRGCNSLVAVNLPEGLEVIHYNAFKDCLHLEDISVPKTVINIGKDAFSGTAFYNNPDNWTDGLFYINDLLLKADNDNILSLCNVKEGTKKICEYAFDDCTNLEDIVLPSSLSEIEMGAFEDCASLESITIPEKVTEIKFSTFKDCEALEKVTFHNNIKSVGINAFSGCTSLKDINIPSSVKRIGEDAFCNTALFMDETQWQYGLFYIGDVLIKAENTEIKPECKIKDGTRMIADAAFDSCENLKSVVIPESVRVIGYNAFCDCENLSEISMPTDLEAMGEDVFEGCTALGVE